MHKLFYLLPCLLILTLSQCNVSLEKSTDPVALHQTHCGNCHLLPDPANIPKEIWKKEVLPEMAARLGHQYTGHNPTSKGSMEENLYIRLSQVYPTQPLVDSSEWWQIHDYIIAQAPVSIPADSLRSNRNTALLRFKPRSISLNENKLIGITNIQYESTRHEFMISDAYGQLYNWPGSADPIPQFLSPLISYQQTKQALFLTEIGYMNPSEKPLGTIYRRQDNSVDTLASELHRPVFTAVEDLNGDGREEVLICEFGNLRGKLSMLVETAPAQFEKRTLLPLPGTIKLEIADMNQDGKKDIIVLASQGKEGIYILYQEEDLQFSLQQVIQMGAEYGTSWFELIDYNGDEHLDLVLVNGDNADYSDFLKPYHGLRLFLNDGKNEFAEKWFYPIYGATRVLCEDYDLDGDLDFAVMAFFPDFDHSQEEGFVWLENKNAAQYTFESHTLAKAKSGRWMVMADGDFDQDGDIDLMLGSYRLPMNQKKYKSVIEHWRAEKTDLLLLENETIK